MVHNGGIPPTPAALVVVRDHVSKQCGRRTARLRERERGETLATSLTFDTANSLLQGEREAAAVSQSATTAAAATSSHLTRISVSRSYFTSNPEIDVGYPERKNSVQLASNQQCDLLLRHSSGCLIVHPSLFFSGYPLNISASSAQLPLST